MIKGEIKNKVADSGIININLSIYAPKETILELDIKQFLFNGLVLKEKEFRLALKEFDFKKYENKIVGVFCGASVIVPMWAYMLITTYLNNMDAKIYFGNKNEVLQLIIKKNINCIDVKDFKLSKKTDYWDETLYCLITDNHQIPIGEFTFWDWED